MKKLIAIFVGFLCISSFSVPCLADVSQFDGTYMGSWSVICPACGDTAAGTFTTTLINGVFTDTIFTITSGTHGILFTSGTVSESGAITATGIAPPQCSGSVSTFTGQIAISSGGAVMNMVYSRPASGGCGAEYGTITAIMLGGSITGVVRDSSGLPIPGMLVYACDYATNQYRKGGVTDPTGSYSIGGLAAGTYKVAAMGSGAQYAAEIYNNQISLNSATPVSVSEGQQTTGIDFSLVPGASISGVVKDSSGVGQANIQVRCYADNGYGIWNQTDATGFYKCDGLPVGYNYNVTAYPLPDSNYMITGISVGVYQPGESPGNDIVLGIGGSITGTVRNSNGQPIADLWITASDYDYGDWVNNDRTDANGVYVISNLAVGRYMIDAQGNGTTYASQFYNNQISWDNATPVDVVAGQQTTGIDFSLELGASISGVVKNSSGIGQANVNVNCWAEDGYGTGTQSEANGFYRCGGLPVGYSYNVIVYPPPDSSYAITGINVDVYQPSEYTGNDIILDIGAILSGKVLDANTAEPLAGVEIDYESQYAERNTFTDTDGAFCLTQLPPGIAEVKAMPDIDSGYAWNLPWASDWVCLDEGENRSGRIITLKKGALVRGHIKDASGNAMGIDYYYTGRDCDGWDDADDINGDYQMRLPVGIYAIAPDNMDEFGALPVIVTITDASKDVNVPDMIVYTEEDGGQISGQVDNPGGYAKTGYFDIIAFKAGTVLGDPNIWYTVWWTAEVGMEDAGPFSFNNLPPDVNYDIYLCVDKDTSDVESLAVRDSALNVSIGTTNINLEYSSQGSTVRGSVRNADDRAILGSCVLLLDLSNSFRGFGNTDCNGQYIIYNVPAGTYTVTAVHSKYRNTSKTVNVIDGIPADVNTIIMPFAGEKEGADLNGNGFVNMLDFAELANQWLRSGSLEADFTGDSIVDFADLSRIAENWLNEAIWYQE